MTETGELCAARFIYVYTCMYTIEDDLPLKHCGGKRAGCVAGSLYSLIVSVDSISCALSLWCCVFIFFVFGQCLIGSIP